MVCRDCWGKKGKLVGLEKCDGPSGRHIVPGTETWEVCTTCNGTGEVPDEVVVETGKTPIHIDDGISLFGDKAMTESMIDSVACPKCKKVFRLKELTVRNGAYLGPSPEGGDVYQIDYFCPRPECGKVVVCDTNGKGNLVVQHGVMEIHTMAVILSGIRK